MIRILVDLLFYTGTKGGMESYVRNLYSSMGRHDFEFVALASRELASSDNSWFPGRVIDSGISGESRIAWAWGELTAVSTTARKEGADLIHAPANIGPWRAKVPVVLTLHDLLPFVRPAFVPGRYAPLLRLLVSRAARNARRVLTISEHSRTDIESVLHISPTAIDVIPLAGSLGAEVFPRERRPDLLIALGNRLPHKNFAALVRAMALLPEALRPHLVITGGGADDPLAPLVMSLGLTRSITLTSWLSQEEVEGLYAHATAVIVPTLFEGFGLPVLEAMARGCPVACSDIPVLREVAGEAAEFFDPEDDDDIAAALSRILGDVSRRLDLTAAGLARAEHYSWQKTADATRTSFQRAIE